MDYIDTWQQFANEQISTTKGIIIQWEAYSNISEKVRNYATPFDAEFKDRFLHYLNIDKQYAESTNMKVDDYKLLFHKYAQMNRSEIINLGQEYKNLSYTVIKKSLPK